MTKAIPLIIFACLWAGAIRAQQEAAAPEPMLAAASRPDSAPATALEGAKAGDSAPLPAAPSAPSPGAALPQWPLPASGTSAATATLVEVADPAAKLPPVSVAPLQAVPLYRQDELLDWIEQGRHLKQVRQDRCQLTQDIEARAKVMKVPSYQFLWGDMLAWGVCVKSDAEQGVKYLWAAALMREAASQGLLKAQLEWVEMLLAGLGSPLDYEEAYQWLHGAVIGDKALHGRAASLLSRLAARMPANAVARAKAMR
ncbi:sel1 repeat family protein [Aeromonas bivalvium]|uniref:sel1 repeat family protein n=1 Tax=Aeromonas bivalvium TaxID=440079 RepID=UPI0038CF762C